MLKPGSTPASSFSVCVFYVLSGRDVDVIEILVVEMLEFLKWFCCTDCGGDLSCMDMM